MANIKKFYDIDGIDYGYKRWERNPVAKFDYQCTKKSIIKFLDKSAYKNSLEIGCGPGTWTSILKKYSNFVTAVDISETMISQAKKDVNESNIDFINCDVTKFEIDKKFDLIFSIRAFEYFPQQEEFIKKCFKMLNDGGKLFVITKTKASYWYGRTKIRKVLKSVFPFLYYYENKELQKNHVGNLENFHQERLLTKNFKTLLRNNDFSDIKIKPVIIRPPIFMRGKSEIPLVPPFCEKPFLYLLKPIDSLFSKNSMFTIFAESYSIFGTKK